MESPNNEKIMSQLDIICLSYTHIPLNIKTPIDSLSALHSLRSPDLHSNSVPSLGEVESSWGLLQCSLLEHPGLYRETLSGKTKNQNKKKMNKQLGGWVGGGQLGRGFSGWVDGKVGNCIDEQMSGWLSGKML